MHVENAVQAFVQYITHHFLHAGHPDRIYVVARPGAHVPLGAGHRYRADMRIPGNRHANGAKAGFLEQVDEFTGGHGLAPGLLVVGRRTGAPGLDPHIIDITAVGIQGVAQVPARAHVAGAGCGILPPIGIYAGLQGFGTHRFLGSLLRNRHLHGRNARRRKGKNGLTRLIGSIGVHFKGECNLIVFIGSVSKSDPIRHAAHFGTGWGRNGQGEGLPRLGHLERSGTQDNLGGSGIRYGLRRIFPITGKNRKQGGEP